MIIDPLGQALTDNGGNPNATFLGILNQLRNAGVSLWASGPTTSYPSNPVLSQLYYDTSLSTLMMCTAVRAGAVPAVWGAVGGGGGGAPVNATYVTMSLNGTLTNERVLTAGNFVTVVDGGANAPVTINAAGVASQIWFSTAPPANPALFPFWWDTTNGNLNVYYTDANSSQWVNANVGVGSAGSYVKLAQVVASGSPATLSFNSIPQTYRTLKIFITGRDTSTTSSFLYASLQINGDTTAANYTSTHYVAGVGTTASSNVLPVPTAAGARFGDIPGTLSQTQAVGSVEITIDAYADTVFQKIVGSVSHAMFGAGAQWEELVTTFRWLNTAAITDLVITAAGTAFVNGTTATLYGMN